VKIPSAKNVALALHLVAEAQRLLEKAELKMPVQLLPQVLRDLADRIETESEEPERPTV